MSLSKSCESYFHYPQQFPTSPTINDFSQINERHQQNEQHQHEQNEHIKPSVSQSAVVEAIKFFRQTN